MTSAGAACRRCFFIRRKRQIFENVSITF